MLNQPTNQSINTIISVFDVYMFQRNKIFLFVQYLLSFCVVKMASPEDDVNIPDELVDKLLNFQQDFEKMSEVLSPLNTLNINSTDLQVNNKIFLLDHSKNLF